MCVCYWSSTNSLQRAAATAAFTAKDSVLREVTVNQNNKTAELNSDLDEHNLHILTLM